MSEILSVKMDEPNPCSTLLFISIAFSKLSYFIIYTIGTKTSSFTNSKLVSHDTMVGSTQLFSNVLPPYSILALELLLTLLIILT